MTEAVMSTFYKIIHFEDKHLTCTSKNALYYLGNTVPRKAADQSSAKHYS